MVSPHGHFALGDVNKHTNYYYKILFFCIKMHFFERISSALLFTLITCLQSLLTKLLTKVYWRRELSALRRLRNIYGDCRRDCAIIFTMWTHYPRCIARNRKKVSLILVRGSQSYLSWFIVSLDRTVDKCYATIQIDWNLFILLLCLIIAILFIIHNFLLVSQLNQIDINIIIIVSLIKS